MKQNLKIQTKKYKEDNKHAAFKTASSLGLEDAKYGSTIPNIKEAYYVIAYEDYEDHISPVVVLVIKDKQKNITYEATVYCYNNNLEEGIKIAKTFKFLK